MLAMTNVKECPKCLCHIQAVHEPSHACGDRGALSIIGAGLLERYVKGYKDTKDSDGIVLCFKCNTESATAAEEAPSGYATVATIVQ